MTLLSRCTFVTLALALGLPVTAQTPAAGTPSAAPSPAKVLATVDGEPIRLAEVRAEVNRVLPMQSFHGTVPAEKIQEFARKALQVKVDRSVKRRDALRRGLTVDDGAVEQALAKLKASYQNTAAFEARMQQTGTSVESLRQALRDDLLVTKVESVVAGEVPRVTTEDARSYYEANLDRFRQPQRAEVRQIFFKMPPQGRTEEKWKAAEKRALGARKRALAAEPFEKLVAELSEAKADEKKRGGLIGTFHRGQLPKELEEVIWKLEEGGVSMPVRTFYGVHLFNVVRRLPPRLVPFPELQEDLITHLQKEREKEHVSRWLSELRAAAKIEYVDPYFAPAK